MVELRVQPRFGHSSKLNRDATSGDCDARIIVPREGQSHALSHSSAHFQLYRHGH